MGEFPTASDVLGLHGGPYGAGAVENSSFCWEDELFIQSICLLSSLRVIAHPTASVKTKSGSPLFVEGSIIDCLAILVALNL